MLDSSPIAAALSNPGPSSAIVGRAKACVGSIDLNGGYRVGEIARDRLRYPAAETAESTPETALATGVAIQTWRYINADDPSA